MNNLYKFSYDYQSYIFWNILHNSIKFHELNNKINEKNKENFNMLYSFLFNKNKQIRKLVYLTICIKLKNIYFRNFYIKNIDILVIKNILVLSGIKNFKEDIKIKLNDLFKNKKYLKDEIIIWFFNKNNIEILLLKDLKNLIICENINDIFDFKQTISGIYINNSDDSTKYTISQNKYKINSKNIIIDNKKNSKKKTETKIEVKNNYKFNSLNKLKKNK